MSCTNIKYERWCKYITLSTAVTNNPHSLTTLLHIHWHHRRTVTTITFLNYQWLTVVFITDYLRADYISMYRRVTRMCVCMSVSKCFHSFISFIYSYSIDHTDVEIVIRCKYKQLSSIGIDKYQLHTNTISDRNPRHHGTWVRTCSSSLDIAPS